MELELPRDFKELFESLNAIEFDEAFTAKNVVQIEDIFVNTISKSDLMTNKLASGRHKNLADIERLKEI